MLQAITHLAGVQNVTVDKEESHCDEGQVRLDALPQSTQNQPNHETTTYLHLSDPLTAGLCELETRPRGNGNQLLLMQG